MYSVIIVDCKCLQLLSSHYKSQSRQSYQKHCDEEIAMAILAFKLYCLLYFSLIYILVNPSVLASYHAHTLKCYSSIVLVITVDFHNVSAHECFECVYSKASFVACSSLPDSQEGKCFTISLLQDAFSVNCVYFSLQQLGYIKMSLIVLIPYLRKIV